MRPQFRWNAEPYFRSLVQNNLLARTCDMQFFLGSGLGSFEQAVDNLQTAQCFCMLTESADGRLATDNSPNAKRVKTIYLAMRHEENNVEERNRVIDTLSEIFRQFISHLNRERQRLHCEAIYIEPVIEFHEFSENTFSGCAAIYFHIPFTVAVDLRFNPKEWTNA